MAEHVELGIISLTNDLAVESPRGMLRSDARKLARERQLCKCTTTKGQQYVRYCCDCGRLVE